MNLRRSFVIGVAFLLAMSSLALAVEARGEINIVRVLSGRYSKHWLNNMMDGEKYWSDDVVEIVPLSDDTAYVRVELEFANGHGCGIFGVAKAENNELVYREPAKQDSTGPQCVLHISKSGSKLHMDDGGVEATCHLGHCGARGMLTWDLPFNSKRPITYMSRLRASPQYLAALSEWNSAR